MDSFALEVQSIADKTSVYSIDIDKGPIANVLSETKPGALEKLYRENYFSSVPELELTAKHKAVLEDSQNLIRKMLKEYFSLTYPYLKVKAGNVHLYAATEAKIFELKDALGMFVYYSDHSYFVKSSENEFQDFSLTAVHEILHLYSAQSFTHYFKEEVLLETRYRIGFLEATVPDIKKLSTRDLTNIKSVGFNEAMTQTLALLSFTQPWNQKQVSASFLNYTYQTLLLQALVKELAWRYQTNAVATKKVEIDDARILKALVNAYFSPDASALEGVKILFSEAGLDYAVLTSLFDRDYNYRNFPYNILKSPEVKQLFQQNLRAIYCGGKIDLSYNGIQTIKFNLTDGKIVASCKN